MTNEQAIGVLGGIAEWINAENYPNGSFSMVISTKDKEIHSALTLAIQALRENERLRKLLPPERMV